MMCGMNKRNNINDTEPGNVGSKGHIVYELKRDVVLKLSPSSIMALNMLVDEMGVNRDRVVEALVAREAVGRGLIHEEGSLHVRRVNEREYMVESTSSPISFASTPSLSSLPLSGTMYDDDGKDRDDENE